MRPIFGLLAGLTALNALPAIAQESAGTVGKPEPGGTGFQVAATELARDLQWLDATVHLIMIAVVLLVVGLLGWALWRYHESKNDTPAKFTHNSPVEIAWTIGPIVILVFIGAFSLPILFKQQEIPEGDINIKVTGYQWYWGYEYTDHDFGFESFMIGAPATGGDNRMSPEVEVQLEEAGFSRDEFLLATDTSVVVPVGKTVVMTVTGADVIHSWTIPAFGVKQDAVPGRLAQLWFEAEKEGTFFGQCSELCGQAHAYMPITVKVVSEEEYEDWLDDAIDEYVGTPRDVTVAASE